MQPISQVIAHIHLFLMISCIPQCAGRINVAQLWRDLLSSNNKILCFYIEGIKMLHTYKNRAKSGLNENDWLQENLKFYQTLLFKYF